MCGAARPVDDLDRFFGIGRAAVPTGTLPRICGMQPVPEAAVSLYAEGLSTGVNGEEIARTVDLYADGFTAREIGERIGRSDTFVRRQLRAAGVELRPRGGASHS